MSEQENNTPPKPKVGSLKDRIAAFEKSAQSDNIPTQKPLPSRTKPGNVSWKPTPSPPKDDGDDEKIGEKKHSGMSADDAKESIAAGGSLKARMAAWQGNIQPSGGSLAGTPPPAPKPLRKPFVPRPPTPDEDDKESAGKQKESVAVPHRRLDNWDPLAAISAAVGARQRSPSPPAPDERTDGETAIETAVEEKNKEEEHDEATKEHERRAALAARMARLGGARIGMAPPIIPKKPKPFVSADEEPVKSNSSAPVRVLPPPGGGIVQSNVETPTEVKETGSDTFRMITADDEITSRAAPVFLSAETPATPEEYERKDGSTADEASSSQTSLASSRSGPGSIPLPALPRRAAPPRNKHSARSLKSDQPTQEPEYPVMEEVSASEEKVSVDEVSETLQNLPATSPTTVPVHDNYEEEHHEVHESTDDKDEEIESHHHYDDEKTVQGIDHHIDDVGDVHEDEEVEEINEEEGAIKSREFEEEEEAEEEQASSLYDEEDIPPPPPPPRRQQSSQSGGGSSNEQSSSLHDDIPLDEEDIPPPPPRRQQSSQSGGGSSREQSSLHDDIPLDEEDIPPPPPRRQQSSQSGVGSSKGSEATSQMANSASTKGEKDFFQGAGDELEDS